MLECGDTVGGSSGNGAWVWQEEELWYVCVLIPEEAYSQKNTGMTANTWTKTCFATDTEVSGSTSHLILKAKENYSWPPILTQMYTGKKKSSEISLQQYK